MLNFLYCFDENYNVQGFLSMYSLLEKVDIKIKIYLIHKSQKDNINIPSKIVNHKNLESLDIFKFENKDLNFYNLENAHVSEATFYRLFCTKYLPENLEKIIYLDADVYCINNPVSILINSFEKLDCSDSSVSFSTEKYQSEDNTDFKRLKLSGNKYFNAGVMLLDLKKTREDNFLTKSVNLINEIKEEAIYWDQDILNKYYDGDYFELDEGLNFKINLIGKDYSEILNTDKLSKEIYFVHYSGKFKPWSVKGSTHNASYIFHELYFELFNSEYYISNARKKQALIDILKIIFSLKIFNFKYPLKFFNTVMRYLVTKK